MIYHVLNIGPKVHNNFGLWRDLQRLPEFLVLFEHSNLALKDCEMKTELLEEVVTVSTALHKILGDCKCKQFFTNMLSLTFVAFCMNPRMALVDSSQVHRSFVASISWTKFVNKRA